MSVSVISPKKNMDCSSSPQFNVVNPKKETVSDRFGETEHPSCPDSDGVSSMPSASSPCTKKQKRRKKTWYGLQSTDESETYLKSKGIQLPGPAEVLGSKPFQDLKSEVEEIIRYLPERPYNEDLERFCFGTFERACDYAISDFATESAKLAAQIDELDEAQKKHSDHNRFRNVLEHYRATKESMNAAIVQIDDLIDKNKSS
ncbi:hypothetical protein PSN45_004960 [Yamadazyma tenuis]|uniref:uncharacterized protein n=1 Tax=Candida tenuis TaxID=2315449 RepID=UPI0027998F60|nr:hypothetical protein PSN45_004960 [Yamadazyma tenuis]